jgi:hypothetical protein
VYVVGESIQDVVLPENGFWEVKEDVEYIQDFGDLVIMPGYGARHRSGS